MPSYSRRLPPTRISQYVMAGGDLQLITMVAEGGLHAYG